jgi:hypothetical protein
MKSMFSLPAHIQPNIPAGESWKFDLVGFSENKLQEIFVIYHFIKQMKAHKFL